jgi:hypothetical protein
MSIEARLRKLEQQRDGKRHPIVVVYEGDPEPENLPPGTHIVRVCYEAKGL